MDDPAVRRLYCVLGARSLPYAAPCLASLFRNALEPVDLTIITDAAADAEAIRAALAPAAGGHRLQVFDKADADARAASFYRDRPATARFRSGHPCWRKITDPPLYAAPGEEVVILDPDVYFPNRFAFEPTPATGVLLMWQRPNCLEPEALVRHAYDEGLAMADHTDIGVCQYRAPLPLDVLEAVIAALHPDAYTRSMHVESIVWAALAERIGGGYLDPTAWHCFANSVPRRIASKLGRSGVDTLRALRFAGIKAFHAGGVAKTWLPEAEAKGVFGPQTVLAEPTPVVRYASYPRAKWETKIRTRHLARRFGLYALLGSH